MGMAASQARLLSITARIHDVEFQAQSIQNAKIQLATQQDAVYQKYMDALDATTMTYKTQDGYVSATFNNLCGYGNMTSNTIALRDSKGRLIVDQDLYEGYQDYKHSGYEDSAYMFALYMMGADVAANDDPDKDNDSFHDVQDSVYEKLTNGGSNEKLSKAREALVTFLKENLGEKDYTGIYDPSIFDQENNTELKNEYNELLRNYYYQLYTVAEYTDPEDNDEYCGAALIYAELTDGKYSDFDEEKYNYYVSKYQQIKQCGGCVSIEDRDFVGVLGVSDASNDSEWLQEMVQSGSITIEAVSMSKDVVSMSSTSPSTDSKISYTPTTDIDKRALQKAEAEYEQSLKQIDKKDKAYDMSLSKLDTQRNALKTEYESIKKVISENVERTFGIFS